MSFPQVHFTKIISTYIQILILLVINIILINLPLANSLGYEFSVINSIVIFFISGILFIYQLKKKSSTNHIVELIHQNKKYLTLLIFVPFLIGLFSTLIQTNCPFSDGIKFYAVITIPTIFFGAVTGYFCYAVFPRKPSLFFILIYIVLLLTPIIEIYFYPQIYFYNEIIGFFPGTIYDEGLSVDKYLIAFRIFNIILFLSIFCLSKIKMERKISRLQLFVSVIILFLGFTLLKPYLQFSTNYGSLKKNLNQIISTENFEIYHNQNFSKTKSEEKYLGFLHEYFLEEIEKTLDVKQREKINSYIFGTKEQKRKLFGSGNADVAKPWLGDIYINFENFDKTLKHELIHVIAKKFGVTIFKVADKINPSIIEGLAMAIENNFDGNSIHSMAKRAYQAGYKYSIEKLFTGLNFFSQTSTISYVYAGSFIKYLGDKYGIEKIKKLYGDIDFQKLFSKNINSLATEYEAFIKSYSIVFNKYQAQLYFGGSTIFKKYCPRMAASDTKKGWNEFSNKNFATALKIFEKVYAYSGSYNALVGIINCYLSTKRSSEALQILNNEFKNFVKSPYYFALELLRGDICIKSNNISDAFTAYDSLIVQNPHIEYLNEVLTRKAIMIEGADSLKKYFEKNPIQKIQKLINLNIEELNYSAISVLIKLCEREDVNIKDFIESIKIKFKVSDYSSSYAAMVTSKYLLKKMECNLAQFFAVLALKYKQDDDSSFMFWENLKMVNWFKNNSSDIKVGSSTYGL